MITLNKSSVVFKAEGHTYHLGEKQLQGITGVLSRRLFKDKYAGISQEVLNNAARRGTIVHELCDLVDSLGVVPDGANQEAMNYLKLKEEKGLVSVASEYLVSDEENYATSIDAVYFGNVGVILNDRKTTSKLDMEYLSWQLSIGAYLFELQNPNVPVDGLSATWLRGEVCEYVEVERKPVELVKALLEADLNDEEFVWDDPTKEIPDFISEHLDAMVVLNKRIKALQAEYDTHKEAVFKGMAEQDIKSVKTPQATFSYVAAVSGTTFDKDAFQAQYPDLFKEFNTKQTSKKASITIKFK